MGGPSRPRSARECERLDRGKAAGKNFSMKVVKVTSKGQVTIPQEARKALGMDEHTYLEVRVEGDEVRLRKLSSIRPLAEDDPIWRLVGSASGGGHDVSGDHDRYLAEGETSRWRESS